MPSGAGLTDLPCDLWTCICQTWLERNAWVIRDLDIAFCKHDLRALFMTWIKGIGLAKYPLSALALTGTRRSTEGRTPFIDWLITRQLSIAFIDITDTKMFRILLSVNPVVLSNFRALSWTACGIEVVESRPWEFLPNLSQLKSLTINGYKSIQHLAAPDEKLEDRLPNLTELTLDGNNECFEFEELKTILQVCAPLKSLRRFELRDFNSYEDPDNDDVEDSVDHEEEEEEEEEDGSEAEYTGVPKDESTWSEFPLLSSVDTLELKNCFSFDGGRLVLFFLHRCPNVTSLTVSAVNLRHHCCRIFLEQLPRLRYLDWGHHPECGFEVIAECANGQSFGEAIDPEPCTDPLNFAQTLDYLSEMIQSTTSPLQRFTCQIGSIFSTTQESYPYNPWHYHGSLLFTNLLGTLTRLKRLNFHAVHLIAGEPEMWESVLSLPVLEQLAFVSCGNMHQSLALGLAHCVTQGVISTSLRTFFVIDYNPHKEGYGKLCAVIPKACPLLTTLVLRVIPRITAKMLQSMVLNLPALRRITLHAEFPVFLSSMTLTMWKAIAARTKCGSWTLDNTNHLEWKHLQRMIDGLGRSLHDLHVVPDSDVDLKFDNPVAKEYLRERRFRVTEK